MSLDVLNCKLGDLKLQFDKDNPVELDRARRAVKNMLRGGFVIFAEVDGKLRRVEDFDEATDSYVIIDVPSTTPEPPAQPESQHAAATGSGDTGPTEPVEPQQRGRPGRKPGKRKLPAADTKATAIAPRAGG